MPRRCSIETAAETTTTTSIFVPVPPKSLQPPLDVAFLQEGCHLHLHHHHHHHHHRVPAHHLRRSPFPSDVGVPPKHLSPSSSSFLFLLSLFLFLRSSANAKLAQSKHNVFPVPVGIQQRVLAVVEREQDLFHHHHLARVRREREVDFIRGAMDHDRNARRHFDDRSIDAKASSSSLPWDEWERSEEKKRNF